MKHPKMTTGSGARARPAAVRAGVLPVSTPSAAGASNLPARRHAKVRDTVGGGGEVSSLNCKTSGDAPEKTVYTALADHQLADKEWRYGLVIQELHRWRAIFEGEFGLDLPEVAFCIGYTRRRCYGYFRPGHNWYGFPREILLNECHVYDALERRQFAEVLATQLHEVGHAWQHKHGSPGSNNYHNAEFRDKARQWGLIVDHRGVTETDPDGSFWRLIRKHGVADIPVPEGYRPSTAPTKQQKWVCGCQPQYGVRVAIDDYDATCNRCGVTFYRPQC